MTDTRIGTQTQIDAIGALVHHGVPLDGKRVAFLPCGIDTQVVIVIDGVYFGKYNKDSKDFDEMIFGGLKK